MLMNIDFNLHSSIFITCCLPVESWTKIFYDSYFCFTAYKNVNLTKICYLAALQGFAVSGANVTPTSYFCVSTMLLLLTIGNQEIIALE